MRDMGRGHSGNAIERLLVLWAAALLIAVSVLMLADSTRHGPDWNAQPHSAAWADPAYWNGRPLP